MRFMAENGGIRVLDRAIAILDLMSSSSDRTGITDIAEATGLPKATVHRILQGLVSGKTVIQSSDGGYVIGPAVLAWADAFKARWVLPKLGQTVIRRLWEGTRETVHLTAFDGKQAYYVDKMESPHPVGMRSRVGASLCLHTTAAGRAILANLPEEELRSYLSSATWEPKTDKTVASKKELFLMLDSARLRGYASENEENEEGIRCVGSAILRGEEKLPVGAISVSVPAYRLEDGDVAALGEAVKEAASDISALLNGSK
jgi:DNA-binding IclR family transcriptional regulator